jgi:hypothetical protein
MGDGGCCAVDSDAELLRDSVATRTLQTMLARQTCPTFWSWLYLWERTLIDLTTVQSTQERSTWCCAFSAMRLIE